jgi:YkoP domain
MPFSPRLHLPGLSPEATLPKSGFPVCPDGEYSGGVGQTAVFQLDRVLRRWQGIYEFSQADDCLLRVAVTRARKRIDLPDGSVVHPGDEIVELHWWNEHVARLVADKPALACAKLLPALVQHSFEQLAKYMATAPKAKSARFIHGDAVLPMRSRRNQIVARVQQYGFWVMRPAEGPIERVHNYFEEYLVRALLWAFHRRKAGRRMRTLRRVDLWATRAEFLGRYGPARLHSAPARGGFEHSV